MIYLLTTNRPEWALFAYAQYLKCTDCRLVVLDNSKECIDFWKIKSLTNEIEHHWIPQCPYNSSMFNWWADQYEGNEDLFYMDDDIEIASETLPTLRKSFEQGFDCAKLCRVYVTKGDKSGIWVRREKMVGACWILKNSLWPHARFREERTSGVCVYFISLWDYNVRLIQEPLANYMIHNKNIALTESMFKFNLPKVTLI